MAIISSRPPVVPVKTRWRGKGERTPAERAGAIGANLWRVSLEIFRHMEKEGFRFGSDRMTTAVIGELIAFAVQLADRAVYGKVGDAERATLIGEAVRHLAATMENNQRDLFGPGDYRKPFIELLNARFGEYAAFEYAGAQPGYACLQFFAGRVADAMAEGDSKWVVEQVIDIEAPELLRFVGKLIEQTVQAATPAPPPAPEA